ncbi:MAG TPA: DUF6335 family protein [Blastocatellia bacterium]|jgi:hypothetical protein|nr:DUF6335 family protein [Blastocatellia bacterium]
MQRSSKKRRESARNGRLPNYDLSEPDREELSKENLAEIGARRIQHELEEHHSTGPALTGGDLDADWQGAEALGDEAVGGHAPTPDQNVIDEIGQAVGFNAADGEELYSLEERVAERDRNRWELDRRSDGDYDNDRSR